MSGRRIPISDLSEEQLDEVVRRASERTGEDLDYVRRALKVMLALQHEALSVASFAALKQ